MSTVASLQSGPPRTMTGLRGWIRSRLFNSIPSSVITTALIGFLIWGTCQLIDWAVLRAVWSVPGGDIEATSACRAPDAGACWAVIAEKYRFILFGLYPYAEQWRPAIVIGIFILLYGVSADRRRWGRGLAGLWAGAMAVSSILMWGGVFGLHAIPEDQWGGLPVTMILATFGLSLGFPIGVLVALGRRSTGNAVIRILCTVYVEIIRSIPLVSVLFMASLMFPLFLPDGWNVSKLLRALAAIAIFASAYIAETVRAGIQALPKGQTEAASALGLGYWQSTLLVILPQAIQAVIPPLVNTFVGFFKATSLVTIIGIFDLLTAASRSVSEPAWQGFGTEVYLFVAAIYFVFCFAMALYSRGLERRFAEGRSR